MGAAMKMPVFEYDSSKWSMNEEWYEQVIIEHLTEGLGYTHLYGPDVTRSSDEYRDVFLPDVLPEALFRINKNLPPAAIEEAILKISNVEGGSLDQRNQVFGGVGSSIFEMSISPDINLGSRESRRAERCRFS